MDLTAEMENYNKVKEIVLNKLVTEGLLEQTDAEEFSERCQVLVYKGKWFSKWFDKNMKTENNSENSYYIRMVELNEREDEVDRLLRRTTGNYDE
jgi:phage anti-repressor protein